MIYFHFSKLQCLNVNECHSKCRHRFEAVLAVFINKRSERVRLVRVFGESIKCLYVRIHLMHVRLRSAKQSDPLHSRRRIHTTSHNTLSIRSEPTRRRHDIGVVVILRWRLHLHSLHYCPYTRGRSTLQRTAFRLRWRYISNWTSDAR